MSRRHRRSRKPAAVPQPQQPSTMAAEMSTAQGAMAARYLAGCPDVARRVWRKAMRYPFGHCEGMLECKAVVGDGGCRPPASGEAFVRRIHSVVHLQEGANDSDEWVLIGRLAGARERHVPVAWFVYTASCDYTGFSCEGGMQCAVASTLPRLVEHGMSDFLREDLSKIESARMVARDCLDWALAARTAATV